jgi:CRP/FNR family cyclic AMP-dependent transcriptional regulator
MPSVKLNSPLTTANFHGPGAKKRLVEALIEQTVVGHDAVVASKLAKKVTLKEYGAGDVLMQQGAQDTHLALILGGSVQILLNNREVAVRRPGDHVGEMALIDNLALRSATVRAVEPTTVAEINEHDFTKLADRHPLLWRRLALTLGKRLRERSKFHSLPREKPAVFIASSAEGHRFALCIHQALGRNDVVPLLWSDGVFESGKTTIEDLVKAAGEIDFAVIVTSKDDVTFSRSRKKTSPRDNVIFELGLFMGAISRERTFVLVPKAVDFKIPSDLLGMTHIPYTFSNHGAPSKAMKEPLKTIRKQIKKHGPK